MGDQEFLLGLLRSELGLVELYLSRLSDLNGSGNGAAVDFLVLESLELAGLLARVLLSLERDAGGALAAGALWSAVREEVVLAARCRAARLVVRDVGVRRVLGLIGAGAERHQRLLVSLR